MRILLAERNLKLPSMCGGPDAEGYAVDLAIDGEEALWLAEVNDYDALLLDVMMPCKDGITVVRHLRRKKSFVPVIFLRRVTTLKIKFADSTPAVTIILPSHSHR